MTAPPGDGGPTVLDPQRADSNDDQLHLALALLGQILAELQANRDILQSIDRRLANEEAARTALRKIRARYLGRPEPHT